eukprot:GEZU01042279.1.p2 GENE.GEZU01042279.1~~GEZU01042279.1.p2  ORF type:complete len:119 (+),score=33.77 GEZU01042279.1:61-417(+)
MGIGQDKRVHYRRKHTYRTVSNRTTTVKTPGGRIVLHVLPKITKGAHTPRYLGSKPLQGLKRMTRNQWKIAPKSARTVTRPYGGVLSANHVKERIIRAFLIEEQKIVKRVLKAQQAKQ